MVRNSVRMAMIVSTLFLTSSLDAAVTVRVDRSTVQITDSIRVIFETDQDVSSRPDFSPLDLAFDVLGTAQSTNVNIINGKMRRSASWTVDLMAKREGALTIPAILIGNEFSEPVSIKVTPAATGPGGATAGDIFLEVEVDTTQPYVQGQVIYTVRLLRAVQISNASLTEPTVSGGDIVIERLGDDVGYETQRGGRTLAVIERRYALFPQSSGKIVVEPLRFEGRATRDRRFALDPFGRGNIVRIRSESVELEVQPIPADFNGRVWLPAQQIFLIESWPENSQEFRVGEPVTRTMTLRAGGLSSSQLPEIDAAVPDGIKQYPDQPTLENRVDDAGLVAIRQEKVALIPSQPGTLILPEVVIPWWNTRTNKLESARLPARPIDVLPAAGSAADSESQPQTPSVIESGELQDALATRTETPNIWAWLSVVFGLGWLITGILWLVNRRRGDPLPERSSPPNEKELITELKRCCSSNDARAAKNALLTWAGHLWPGSRAHSLGDLAARLDGEIQLQIHRLSQHLYNESATDWNGSQLWLAFDKRQQKKVRKTRQPEPELEPLYLQ